MPLLWQTTPGLYYLSVTTPTHKCYSIDMSTIIHSESSEYGTYRIVDTTYNRRPARILYGSDNSPQSGTALDDDEELLFDYNQRFMEMIMSCQPKKILVIGGGTCTLPSAAHRLFPDLEIDVIEIDKLLIELAYRFFELPRSPRLRVFINDALHHLASTKERYDMIIIDAFHGYTIPPHLLEPKTILMYKNHLTDRGVIAINVISEYKQNQPSLANETVDALSQVFSDVAVYQSDPDYQPGADQNLLLAASSQEIHFDYLQSKEVKPAK